MPPQDLEALWSIRFGAIYPTAQGPVAYVVCLGNVWCTLGGTILGRPVFVARSLITHPKVIRPGFIPNSRFQRLVHPAATPRPRNRAS